MINERTWREVIPGVEISKDGYLRKTKYDHLISPSTKKGRKPSYVIYYNNQRFQRNIDDLVRKVWGISITVTDEMALKMRQQIMGWNEVRPKWVDYHKKEPVYTYGPPMPCPWSGHHDEKGRWWPPISSMTYGFDWLDPIMDPFVNRMEPGVWVNIRDIKECAA